MMNIRPVAGQVATALGRRVGLRRLPPGRNVIEGLTGTRQVFHLFNPTCELADGLRKSVSRAPSAIERKLPFYGPRMAGSTPANGVILIPRELEGIVRGQLEYLAGLGLAAPNIRIITVPGDPSGRWVELALRNIASVRRELDQVSRGKRPVVMVPFIGSTRANRLAAHLGIRAIPDNLSAIHRANNKCYSLEALERFGVPVP